MSSLFGFGLSPLQAQAAEQRYAGGKGGESKGADAAPVEVDPVVEARFAALRSVGEECQTEADLRQLLTKKPAFNLYDGFEPSGRMHIAQGVFKAMNVNKCTAAGGTFIFWVADWFALMNDKMGGDLDKIKDVGRYLIEVWTAAGMDMEHVVFKWASDDICKKVEDPAATAAAAGGGGEEKKEGDAGAGGKKKKKSSKKVTKPLGYWPQMLDIARRFSIARIEKCCQALGRAEGTLTAAQILYPLMQVKRVEVVVVGGLCVGRRRRVAPGRAPPPPPPLTAAHTSQTHTYRRTRTLSPRSLTPLSTCIHSSCLVVNPTLPLLFYPLPPPPPTLCTCALCTCALHLHYAAPAPPPPYRIQVLRRVPPQGGHLPARCGPAEGKHARAGLLRHHQAEAEAGDLVAPHAVRVEGGPGEDEQVGPGLGHFHGRLRR
jgi:hypothetical protein